MVMKPTYDDANLILRLYEMRREDKMRTARDWFAQNFHFKTMEDYNRQCPALLRWPEPLPIWLQHRPKVAADGETGR